MKVGQTNIVRWISQRVAKRTEPVKNAAVRELNADQLRHVSGGTSLPNKGW
jgi:hypothetical protein